MWKPRVPRFALILVAVCSCAGCAFTHHDNRRLLNLLDRQAEGTWFADTTAGRITAAPIAIPVGTAAFALDVAVIQPVCAVPPAAKDTYDLLWKPRKLTAFRKMILFVPVVAATPIVFVSDWAFRSLFDTG
jgi:hypothetical protein